MQVHAAVIYGGLRVSVAPGDLAAATLRFHERQDDGYRAYRAVCDDGYVRFFAVDPAGASGAIDVDITMADGSARQIRGAWSSNSAAVNRTFRAPHCIEVALVEGGRVWAGALTVDRVSQILNEQVPGWRLTTTPRSLPPDHHTRYHYHLEPAPGLYHVDVHLAPGYRWSAGPWPGHDDGHPYIEPTPTFSCALPDPGPGTATTGAALRRIVHRLWTLTNQTATPGLHPAERPVLAAYRRRGLRPLSIGDQIQLASEGPVWPERTSERWVCTAGGWELLERHATIIATPAHRHLAAGYDPATRTLISLVTMDLPVPAQVRWQAWFGQLRDRLLPGRPQPPRSAGQDELGRWID